MKNLGAGYAIGYIIGGIISNGLYKNIAPKKSIRIIAKAVESQCTLMI